MALINKRNLGLLRLQGVLLILFGIIALIFPDITLFALAVYFGISFLLAGLILIIISMRLKASISNWGYILAEGITGIILGLVIITSPRVSATVFLIILGVYAIIMGLFFLAGYFSGQLTNYFKGSLLVTGIISLLFGILLVVNPFDSTRMVTLLAGIYALIYGIFSVMNITRRFAVRA